MTSKIENKHGHMAVVVTMKLRGDNFKYETGNGTCDENVWPENMGLS